MPSSWLLIETLDQRAPSVIAQGSAVKAMVPIESFFKRSKAKDALAALISNVCESAEQQQTDLPGDKRATAEPICNDWGQVHGVWLRSADLTETSVPSHNRAWAFVWNLTRGTVTRSKGLVPEGSTEEHQPKEWTIAEAFSVLETGADASETLVKVINAAPGTRHQTTWPQKRPDGTRHDVNFAVRITSEPPPDAAVGSASERILRGISHDLGLAEERLDPESPIMLAELVAATTAEPGEYRAIFELRPLRLLRWYGEPCPDLAWEYDEIRRQGRPQVHPDDQAIVQRMQRDLDAGRAFGRIRLLTRTGDYEPYDVIAKLIILNRSTTAALITVRRA
ncbi:GAF domain-containing protein [Nocardia sp. NPDC049149]|uniref:GAF domain-containing protein n=1 Tax=Nocardia sp. NPDC049149 TaxID=3364315 RepID=UPI00371C6BDA